MEYIRIEFINLEPLRIADDSTSQSGQTDTLTYLPGSTLRGAVIEELRHEREMDQEEINRYLSEKVRFLNAYPVCRTADKEQELIPSMKGFYEDKKNSGPTAKSVESVVVNGSVRSGLKRAVVGTFGYPDNGIFRYSTLEKSGDLKINLGREKGVKKNVFRNQYLCAGYRFAAYIGTEDNELKAGIRKAVDSMKENDRMILGNARSFGLGRCRILDIRETSELPYAGYAQDEDISGSAYMLLLSDMAMRSEEGEIVGIREDVLRQETGLQDLTIEYCSTSVVNVCGYNRAWRTRIPSVPMYEMGSLFKLKFKGTLSLERMLAIEHEGLGIRRSEGFGRVLFVKDYEKIKSKQKIDANLRSNMSGPENAALTEEDQAVLKIAAKGVYLHLLEQKTQEYLRNPPEWSGSISKSQMGTVRSILSKNRFAPSQGKEKLQKYLAHQNEKEEGRSYQTKTGASSAELTGAVAQILEDPLTRTLGIQEETVFGQAFTDLFTSTEVERLQMGLLIRRLDRENREDRANG